MSMSPEQVLQSAGIKFRRHGREAKFDCPNCGKNDACDINLKTGLWCCLRASCNESGNIESLMRMFGLIYNVTGAEERSEEKPDVDVSDYTVPSAEHAAWHQYLFAGSSSEAAREYMKSRGFTHDVMAMAQIGYYPRQPGTGSKGQKTGNGLITIPYVEGGKCVGAKLRWVPPEPERDGKPWRYTKTKGSKSTLYDPAGMLTKETKTVLVVGGELDALSVIQAQVNSGSRIGQLDIAVVAPPDGEGSWPQTLIDQLAHVEMVCIALDSDAAGQDATDKLAKALGMWRCSVARWPEGHNDANSALCAGVLDLFSLHAMMNDADVPASRGIVKPSSLRSQIEARIQGSKSKGWTTGIDGLNDLFGGWRPYELTILTGGTGAGKTTMAVQQALTVSIRGVKVFVAPLEGGATAFSVRCLRAYHKKAPQRMSDEELDQALSLMDKHWHFLDHDGRVEVEPFLATVRYMVEAKGAQFVIVDHLHYALKQSGKDRWEQQNKLCAGLVDIAKSNPVHIVLLAQCSKPYGHKGDDFIPQMSDIKGEVAAVQEASNFLAMYRPRRADRKQFKDDDGNFAAAVIVGKCRDEAGTEGSVELVFNKDAGTYMEKT